MEPAPVSAIGQSPVCVHELPQRHIRRAQRQGRAIKRSGFVQLVDANIPQGLNKRLNAEHFHCPHRRDVQGRCQRDSGRYLAPVRMVVIPGPVDAARNRQIERTVIQKGCRGQDPPFKGSAVKKGLQRRSGLAFGDNAVHESRAGRVRGVARIGKDISGQVLDNENGAFPHIARFKRNQMMRKPFLGKLLQPGIERAGDRGLFPAFQKPAGDMWRRIHAAPDGSGTQKRLRDFFPDPHIRGLPAHRKAKLFGPLGHFGSGCIGRADEGRQNQRLRFVQTVGIFSEKSPGGRGNALKLTGIINKVQICLQNLILAPGALDIPCRLNLKPLLSQRPPPLDRLKIPVQKRGQLHADGAGAPQVAGEKA